MRVLSLGTDRKLLEEGSAVSMRVAAYAEHFERYDTIVFSRRGYKSYQYANNGIAYPTNAPARFLYPVFAFFKALTLGKPTIVTVQDPFEVGITGYMIARWFGVPLHVQAHTDFLAPQFRRASLLNRLRTQVSHFVLSRAAGVRVVSDRIAQEIDKRLGVEVPIAVLPVYVDISRFAHITRVKHPRFMVSLLYIGRLEAEKNVSLALDALKRARDAHHDAGLTIVGTGSEEEKLKKYADLLGVTSWVVWAGWKSDFMSELAQADIVLLPSLYEGYGLVIIEALAAGVPVLATDVGVAQEAGALVTSRRDFAPALVRWIESGPRQGVLQNYPYRTFEEFVARYVQDLKDCVPA